MCQSDKGKALSLLGQSHVFVQLGVNVSSSTHNCGCMVDGGKSYGSNLSIIFNVDTCI